MSLFRYTDFLTKTDALKKIYRGIVVSNDDPKKMGRVKVTVDSLFSGTSEELPWVYPKNTSGLGGRGDSGWFGVPQLSSELIIEFPFNDIYSGFYTGYWKNESTRQGTGFEDYPYSYGFRDPQGSQFFASMAKKFTEYLHTSGSGITFAADGTVEIRSPKMVTFKSRDGQTAIEFGMKSGKIKLAPKEGTEFGGRKTKINSTELNIDVATFKESVSGGKETTVFGGLNETVAGSVGRSVLSNQNSVIGGDATDLVTQRYSRTTGMGITETIVAGGSLRTFMAGNITENVTLGNILYNLLAGKMTVTATAGAEFNVLASFAVMAAAGIDLTTAAKLAVTAATGIDLTTLAKLAVTAATGIDLTTAAKLEVTAATGVNLTTAANFEVTAISAKITAPTITIGGASPSAVLSLLTDPIADYITGIPHVGVPTVLVG